MRSRQAEQHGRERLGLALRDPGGGLVEQDHARLRADLAREVDDATAAGREVGDELVAELAQPHRLDELVGALAEPPFRARDGRKRAARRCTGSPERELVVERDAHGLVDGECAEEPRVLERARQTQPCTRRRAQARQVVARRAGSVRRFGTRKPETTSKSVVLPAPFGPISSEDLAVVQLDRDVVERHHAGEASCVTPSAASTTPRGLARLSCCGRRPAGTHRSRPMPRPRGRSSGAGRAARAGRR